MIVWKLENVSPDLNGMDMGGMGDFQVMVALSPFHSLFPTALSPQPPPSPPCHVGGMGDFQVMVALSALNLPQP